MINDVKDIIDEAERVCSGDPKKMAIFLQNLLLEAEILLTKGAEEYSSDLAMHFSLAKIEDASKLTHTFIEKYCKNSAKAVEETEEPKLVPFDKKKYDPKLN